MTTSDYQTVGNTVVFNTETKAFNDKILEVYQDSYAKTYENNLYILEAGQNSNLIKLDNTTYKLIYQYSVEPLSNPHDIIFYKSNNTLKAYILRYNKPSIWIVNPEAASDKDFKTGEIDISQWSDEDGSPEAHIGFLYNGYVYVILQRYNLVKYVSETAYIIKIDPVTDKIVDMDPDTDGVNGIELINKNPIKGSLIGNTLYLGGTVYFGEDIGIMSINLDDPMNSQKRVLSEAAIGGTFADMKIFSADMGIVSVYDQNWNMIPYYFNPTAGVMGNKLPVPDAGGGVVMTEGKIYVGSRNDVSPGLYIVDPVKNELIGEPYITSLPAYSIASTYAVDNTNIVTETEKPSIFSVDAAYPNPFNNSTTINYTISKAANVKIEVYNTLGQKVKTIADSYMMPGKHSVKWNAGSISSGNYYIRFSDGISIKTSKVSFMK